MGQVFVHIARLSAADNARVRRAVRGMVASTEGGQAAVAARIGITSGGLSHFLRGRNGASMALAMRVAAAAGVDVSDLVDLSTAAEFS